MSDSERKGLTADERKKRRSVKSPHDESFSHRLGAVCGSLIGWIVFLIVFNALSVAAIIIGSTYRDASYCPGQPNLAITLIFSGILAIILSAAEAHLRIKSAAEDEGTETPDYLYVLLCLLRVAKSCLFIYLCVLVFSLYPVVDMNHAGGQGQVPKALNGTEIAEKSLIAAGEAAQVQSIHYCHPTLFIFAFVTILLVIIVAILWICIACCICLIAILFVTS